MMTPYAVCCSSETLPKYMRTSGRGQLRAYKLRRRTDHPREGNRMGGRKGR